MRLKTNSSDIFATFTKEGLRISINCKVETVDVLAMAERAIRPAPETQDASFAGQRGQPSNSLATGSETPPGDLLAYRPFSIKRLTITLMMVSLLFTSFKAQAETIVDTQSRDAVLVLSNGEVIHGEAVSSDNGKVIRWLGKGFLNPFEFRTQMIEAVHYRNDAGGRRSQTIFEMRNGDIISGDLVRWDQDSIVIFNPVAGELNFAANHLRWLYRDLPIPASTNGAHSDQDALIRMNRWGDFNVTPPFSTQQSNKPPSREWIKQGTTLKIEKAGQKLRQAGQVKCLQLDLKLSWKSKGDFVLSFVNGTGGTTNRETLQGNDTDTARALQSPMDGWRLECAGNQLVMTANFGEYFDLAEISSLDDQTSLRLLVHLDLANGSMEVLTADGLLLGSINVPDAYHSKIFQTKGADGSEDAFQLLVELENLSNAIEVEKLKLSEANAGIAKPGQDAIRSKLTTFLLKDGRSIYGDVLGYDQERKALRIKTDSDEEQTLAFSQVTQARPPIEIPKTNLKKQQFHLIDGSILSGQIDRLEQGDWTIISAGTAQKVQLPKFSLRSVVNRNVDRNDTQEKPVLGRIGRLTIAEQEIAGRLVPVPDPLTSKGLGLAWHPLRSLSAAEISIKFNGRLIFKEKVSRSTSSTSEALLEQQRIKNQRLKRGLNFGELFLSRTDLSTKTSAGRDSHLLHFRSGDVLRCRVLSISQKQITLDSTTQARQIIDANFVKAIEFVSNSPPPSVETAKKQRLLTIPRLQKSEPPSHLLCSHNGDFLRCRLMEMGNDFVTVQVQGDKLKVPRERIAQVIWFHADETIDGETGLRVNKHQPIHPKGDPVHIGSDGVTAGNHPLNGKEEEPTPSYEGSVQVVLNDGKRTTFQVTAIDQDWISGESKWQGPCKFDLGRADELLFGNAIPEAVTGVAYNQWKFQTAVEPLVSAVLNGQEANEPGKPARIGDLVPETLLQTTKGDPVDLRDFHGTWLMIDFWTTWSGASRKAKPKLEEIRIQLAARGFKSVSVSVGESRERVIEFATENPFTSPVFLDLEGELAKQLGVRELPMLFFVSPEGKVAAIFNNGDELSESDFFNDLLARLDESDTSRTQEKPAASERD